MKQYEAEFDIYSEFFPASSATIIGAGFVTLAMGSMLQGGVIVSVGIAIGTLGSLSRIRSHKMMARKR